MEYIMTASITYVKSDLFDTNIDLIVHGCNSKGVMGSGVAAIVKEKFPKAFEVYRDRCRSRGLDLGEIVVVEDNGKTIINAITQGSYGRDGKRHVDYEAVATAFDNIVKMIKENSLPPFVAMPQIGAGLGGGNWKIIECLIEDHLTSQGIEVYVYIL